MRRHRHRLDDLEAPPMLERRDPGAGGSHRGRIDFRHHNARLGFALGENTAPWVDHDGVTERIAAVLMMAALGRRQHETTILDGARAVEDMPMGVAGLVGEGRWAREE